MQNGKRTRSKLLNLRIYTLTYSRRNFLEFKSEEILIFLVQENAIFKMKVGNTLCDFNFEQNNNKSLSILFYSISISIIECYYISAYGNLSLII